MLNLEHFRKMMAVTIVTLLVATAIVVAENAIQSAEAQDRKTCCGGGGGGIPQARQVPMALSGNNLYMAWPNNDTGHWNVFYAKSTDEGKTFAKNIMLSAPNKGHVVDQDTQIAASGSNVFVTWWTNKTGTLMPVFRASNDNGDTFAKAITLNSTG
jgi:hypothetical protein